MWKGLIKMSNFNYENHYKFKKNRLKALEKYNYKCQRCGRKAQVVHHADMSTDNHNLDNLVPLCAKCHVKLHKTLKIDARPTWNPRMIEYGMMRMGMDKQNLADAVGINSATLTHILKTGNTKNSTMKEIAAILGMPLKDFITIGPDEIIDKNKKS